MGRSVIDENCRGVSRRSILKAGMISCAGLILMKGLPSKAAAQTAACSTAASSAAWNLTPFIDQLPIMPTLRPTTRGADAVYYEVSVDQTTHRFHSQLPPTPVWAFNGTVPGPTFDIRRNQTVRATFTNNLSSYLLCPDPNIHGAWPDPYLTIHNHGLLDRQDSDGFPEDRFPPGESYTYEYPGKFQRASLYWYHDHNLGVTRLAVNSGLAGLFIVRDRAEDALNLPSGGFEVPLIIQDRSFADDGSLWLPSNPWEPEFFGDFPTVNGIVYPRLEVSRGKYRFRVLNASNARFYNFTLDPPPPPGSTYLQIGSDGGLLESPVDLTNPSSTATGGLLLAPAERADIIIDFSAYPAGTQVYLKNDAPAPFPGGGANPIDVIMRFDVTAGDGWKSGIPARLSSLPARQEPVKTRFLTLVDYGSPAPGYPPPPANAPYPTLLLNNKRWMEPPTETPKANTTEIWNLINLAPDTHPIHIHQTQFRILDRRDFDVEAYLAKYGVDGPVDNPDIPFTGPPIPPDRNEEGLKDTVRANPGQVTRIEVPFGPFRGRFVWHCHILDHEDNEMMRPLLIT